MGWYDAVLSGIAGTVSLLFTAVVFLRYLERRHLQMLWWSAGFLIIAIAILAQAYYAAFGWQPVLYRLWYLFGAILAAAWLGQGTLHLLASRRTAVTVSWLLLAVSFSATLMVFSAELDPSRLIGLELSGNAIVTPGVRTPVTPLLNVYGTITLVGGALYSTWHFWRTRTHFARMIGCFLIALGGLSFALGGTFSRFGLSGLYLSQLVGSVILFVGFLFTLRPDRIRVKAPLEPARQG